MKFKHFVITCLALTVPSVLGDSWSWGQAHGPSPAKSSRARSFDTTPVIPLSRDSKSLSPDDPVDTKEDPHRESDTAPRFLGLGDKLCSIGIGINCKKPLLANPNSIHGVARPGIPIPGSFPAPVITPTVNHNSYPPPVNHNSYPPPVNHNSYPPPVNQNSFVSPPRPHQALLPSHSSPHAHEAEPTIVHHHTHTHIHHTPGSDVHPVPHPHGDLTGNFQPSPGLLSQEPLFRPPAPAYREECTCVHASFCSSYDVIARSSSNDISDLIDARNRNPDIKSNATSEADDEENSQEGGSAKEDTSRLGNSFSAVEARAGNRTRRDTLTGGHHADGHHADGHHADGHHADGHHADGLHGAVNVTSDAQGRTLRYTPGQAGCGAAYVCCRNPHQQAVHHQPVCGQRRSNGIVGRVKNPHYVNGDTEFGEYPWHVAILDVNGVYISGGALIDDRHVVTAAHSINNINPLQMVIRLGDWDVSGQHEFYQHIELPVAYVVIHPEFYAGNLQNDIAVIRMQGYVDFNAYPHVSPICLPDLGYSYFVGKRCHSTGWGKDAFGDHGQFQTILKEVELPIVEHHQCEAALRQTRLGYQFSLHQGMLCAGGEQGMDTCEGDGGGPLVCTGPDGSLQLAGLVSWGIGCGQYGVPGVYVNVGHYIQWIHTITSAP